MPEAPEKEKPGDEGEGAQEKEKDNPEYERER